MWAEAIPDLGAVVGLFFLVAGYIVVRGLLASWQNSIGLLLEWVASHARIKIPYGFGSTHIDFGGPFHAVDAWTVSYMQAYCEGAETAIGLLFHGLREMVVAQAESFEWLARESSQAWDGLLHIHLPKWAKTFVTAGLLGATVGKLVYDAVRRLVPNAAHTVRVITHEVVHERVKILRIAAEGALPVPLGLPKIIEKIRNALDQSARLEHRMRRVEALAGAGAFAAAIANVWGIPLRCAKSGGPIARLARSMCGLPGHFLNDVFGLLADFFVLENICTVLPWVEDAGSAVGAPLIAGLTEIGAGLCAPEAGRPGTLAVPALYLPLPTDSLLAGV
jgi:hypothetical protein